MGAAMFRTLTIRWFLALAFVLPSMVATFAVAQVVVIPELAQLADAGADVSLLAATPIGQSPDDRQALLLSRVVPVSSSELPIVIVAGEELWFVESGRVTLTGDTGEVITTEAGEQALVTTPGQYSVAFEGDSCPSALRLEFSSVIAMRMSSDEVAPELGPDGVPCPTGGTLIEAAETVSPRTVPALGFIARLTLPKEVFLGPPPYSGPVGYAVEAGAVTLSGPDEMNIGIGAGSWAAVASGQAHWIYQPGPGSASLLMVGAFATGDTGVISQPTSTPTPVAGVSGTGYVSPSYGYGLSWDEAWSVVAESSDAGVDSIHLTNGVSQLYVQSYGAFTGDAMTCVDGIIEQLPAQPGFSNVRPRMTADDKPIISGDASRRIAVFDFTYTTETGVSEYTESIECRVLGFDSVVIVTHIVLADAYAQEFAPVRDVIATFTMPGES